MQFILLTVLLVLSFLSVESNNRWLPLYKALFNRQSGNNCVASTNNYCPIINAIDGIFPSGGDNTDWNIILNTIPDEETLDWIILLGLQQFVLFVLDNPESEPTDFNEVIQELVRITQILADEGSTAVLWRDLKPLVQKFLLSTTN